MLNSLLGSLKNRNIRQLMLRAFQEQQSALSETKINTSSSLRFYYQSAKPSVKHAPNKWSRRPKEETSNQILKDYFSRRLSMTSKQLEKSIVQISKTSDLSRKDHRWESLYMTIEKYHSDFELSSKIHILQALGRLKENNSLYIALFRDTVAHMNELTLDQISVLLWSMVKVEQNDKGVVLAIYRRIYQIISSINQEKREFQQREKDSKSQNETGLGFNEDFQHRRIILVSNFLTEDEVKGIQEKQAEMGNETVEIMRESNFVRLIWSLKETKVVDQKQVLKLLKAVLSDQNAAMNLRELRLENLCLLLNCLVDLEFCRYRITQQIIGRIQQLWERLESLNVLTLNVLVESLSKCIQHKQNQLRRFSDKLSPEEAQMLENQISKEKKFILLTAETIFLNQDRLETKKKDGKIVNPLSQKFSSQIIHHMGKIRLYEPQIWSKLLYCLTLDIDHAQVQDLSMAISGMCMIPPQEAYSDKGKTKQEHNFYQQKVIICRRIFQIFNSLKGKSLGIIEELVYNDKIDKKLVPARVRKEIQKKFAQSQAQEQKPPKSGSKKWSKLSSN